VALLSQEKRAQINRLIADCAAFIDNFELEEWPECFTEKCIYKVVARSDYDKGRPAGFIYCDRRDMLIDRVRSIRSVNVFQPHLYRHILGPTRILREQDGVVYSETSYVVVRTLLVDGTMAVFSAGRCLDEIVFENGRAMFRSRIVVTDSDSIDMLLVLPI